MKKSFWLYYWFYTNIVLFWVHTKTHLSMHNLNNISSCVAIFFFSFKDDLSQSLWSSGSEIHLNGIAACCLSFGCNTYPMSPTSSATPAPPIPQDSNNILQQGTLRGRSAFHLSRLPCIIPDSLPSPSTPATSIWILILELSLGFVCVYSTFVHSPRKPLECSCCNMVHEKLIYSCIAIVIAMYIATVIISVSRQE